VSGVNLGGRGERDGLGVNRGSPQRFRRVGIEGPKISVSRMPARRPFWAKLRARLTFDLR
jgi:hypothetical protein